MVKVLVWNSKPDKLRGFWAEFEGEEINSYQDDGIVYTLYKCTYYDFEAYRVHVKDETNPKAPKYELLPQGKNRQKPGDYARPYHLEDLAEKHPRFLKDLVDFPTHTIDAELPPS